jgi:hypothetical protein
MGDISDWLMNAGRFRFLPFLLVLPEPEELDNTSHCKRHAISILSICDIECRSAALDFARQEREVHVVRSNEVRSIRKFANKGRMIY